MYGCRKPVYVNCVNCCYSDDLQGSIVGYSYTNRVRWANYIYPPVANFLCCISAENCQNCLALDKVIATTSRLFPAHLACQRPMPRNDLESFKTIQHSARHWNSLYMYLPDCFHADKRTVLVVVLWQVQSGTNYTWLTDFWSIRPTFRVLLYVKSFRGLLR